jgi:hypothetical protein
MAAIFRGFAACDNTLARSKELREFQYQPRRIFPFSCPNGVDKPDMTELTSVRPDFAAGVAMRVVEDMALEVESLERYLHSAKPATAMANTTAGKGPHG